VRLAATPGIRSARLTDPYYLTAEPAQYRSCGPSEHEMKSLLTTPNTELSLFLDQVIDACPTTLEAPAVCASYGGLMMPRGND
jgi:hypothetical protein